MRFSSTTALAVLASAVVAIPLDSVGDTRAALEAARSEVTRAIDTVREKKMAELKANKATAKSKRAVGTCDASNVAIRKE